MGKCPYCGQPTVRRKTACNDPLCQEKITQERHQRSSAAALKVYHRKHPPRSRESTCLSCQQIFPVAKTGTIPPLCHRCQNHLLYLRKKAKHKVIMQHWRQTHREHMNGLVQSWRKRFPIKLQIQVMKNKIKKLG